MTIDARHLIQESIEALREPSRIGAAVAVGGAVLMIAGLDIPIALALLLSAGVYAGTVLVATKSPQQPAELSPDPDAALTACIGDLREQISGLIDQISTASVSELVGDIVVEIDRMETAIEEDKRAAVAPLYCTRFLEPFLTMLSMDVKLRRRPVKLASSYLAHIESVVLPRYHKAAQEFYEEYHNQEVLDLAALAEIMMYNLDTIDELSANGVEIDDRRVDLTPHDELLNEMDAR